MRVNAARVNKPATHIKPGDGLTFAQADSLRIVRVIAIGTRRGPVAEAQALYADLTPEPVPLPPRVGARPTKKDRRDLDAFHQSLPQSVLEFGNDDD